MDIFTNFPDHKTKKEEEEDEEESLSLRDFPLSWDEPLAQRRDSSNKIQDKRRSSSEPSEFFEFFNDFSSEMSNAEDIIFCGKLVPYQNPHHQILKSHSADDATHLSRRCCDSTQFNSARSNNNNKRLSRHYRSKKARRRHPEACVKPEGGSKIVSKPWWFVMMFGPLKLQPEMDLRDMKNRQVRRSPGSLFPGGKAPANRSDRRSFWGHDLLRVLSCKTHASVAVTTSIGFMPHF
ncbi:hypothetical protein ACS0TY_031915 [Phlomoides rotata]